MIIGVIPRFQRFGIESAIIVKFSEVAYMHNFPYKTAEFNWVGDFLPVIGKLYESFGSKIVKKHITYRKLFDETKVFKRHPVIQ
jgi:hypothetical protein